MFGWVYLILIGCSLRLEDEKIVANGSLFGFLGLQIAV